MCGDLVNARQASESSRAKATSLAAWMVDPASVPADARARTVIAECFELPGPEFSKVGVVVEKFLDLCAGHMHATKVRSTAF